MKKIKIFLVLVLILMNVLIPISNGTNTDTSEQQIKDGIYRIKSCVGSNKYLDISAGSKENGANLQIWDKSDVEQQQFQITYLNNGHYKIEAIHSEKVLDVAAAGTSNGTNVWQYESNDTDAQQWIIEEISNGKFRIMSKCNDLCLDVDGANTGNGTNIQVYQWNGSNAQLFKLEEVENIKAEKTIESGTYKINTKLSSNKYLDIDGGSKEKKANLQIWDNCNVNQQKFKVTYLNNGYYKIEAVHSEKALDVKYSEKANGTNVWQYTYNESDAQQWVIKDLDNGYYRIISKCNNLSLDVDGANTGNGTNVQVYEWNGSNAQQFKFEKVEPLTGKKTIEDGTYKIRLSSSKDMLVSVETKNKANGANVSLEKDNEYKSQKFKVTYLNNGFYKIEAVHSNKVLDVVSAGTDKGTNVWQYEWNGSDAQQWVIKEQENGCYSLIAKCSELYLDVNGGSATSGTNIQTYTGNNSQAQKFIFEKTEVQAIDPGLYEIEMVKDKNKVLEVQNGNSQNEANVQIGERKNINSQKFYVEYNGKNKNYKITMAHSNKVLDVCGGTAASETNVQQYESNDTKAQRWKINENGDGSYTIVSECGDGNLVLDVYGGNTDNGTNVQIYSSNNTQAQKFKFIETELSKDSNYVNIDSSRYPLYKEAIESIKKAHPNWEIKLLYTGLSFSEAVYGEYSYHGANLVSSSSGNEWICPICGTKEYDTGNWYCASDKAIAYYMDPRNFINEGGIYQFLDANKYEPTSVSIDAIQANVNGTFLEKYANDINNACRNQGVNPYYVISRLIQENGKNGSYTSNGMDGGDGKTYYNPFNIGAYKTANATVKQNALAKAKANGWDTMEKALEGGIVFLKSNWLDNYQNTLYQNRFDIDSTNGTSLYSHQYMQNLSAAYTEGLLLKNYYTKANKTDTNLTFIIPVYEGMSTELSPKPSEGTSSEEYPMNVAINTQGGTLALRSGASTSSSLITRYANGTVLLSIKRGINSTWQQVVTKDGQVGYMSGEYLRQINDEWTCNYKAYIKTQQSGGTNVRTGPSTKEGFSKVEYLPDYTSITVMDDSTYSGYEGTEWCNWSRIILEDGRQAFVPSHYVIRQ